MFDVVSETDLNFYIHFSIAPIGRLSNCEYDNMFRLGVSYGEDICDYIDEDPEINHCKTCEKAKQETLYYPPITDFILVNLLILAGTKPSELPIYCGRDEDKSRIFEHVKVKCWSDNTLRDKVRDLLIGHLQEWSRL